MQQIWWSPSSWCICRSPSSPALCRSRPQRWPAQTRCRPARSSSYTLRDEEQLISGHSKNKTIGRNYKTFTHPSLSRRTRTFVLVPHHIHSNKARYFSHRMETYIVLNLCQLNDFQNFSETMWLFLLDRSEWLPPSRFQCFLKTQTFIYSCIQIHLKRVSHPQSWRFIMTNVCENMSVKHKERTFQQLVPK